MPEIIARISEAYFTRIFGGVLNVCWSGRSLISVPGTIPERKPALQKAIDNGLLSVRAFSLRTLADEDAGWMATENDSCASVAACGDCAAGVRKAVRGSPNWVGKPSIGPGDGRAYALPL